MTPCCRLYGVIGLELAAAYPDVQHLYKEWIITYSSPGYLSVPDAQEALLDEVGASSEYGAHLTMPSTLYDCSNFARELANS